MGGGAAFTKANSRPSVVNPFGGVPYRQAGGYGQTFSNPLRSGFGFTRDTPYQRQFEGILKKGGGGTLGDFIRGGRDYFSSDPLAAARKSGADIAARAPATFDLLNDEVANFLETARKYETSRAGYEGAQKGAIRTGKEGIARARDTTGRARQLTGEAFSPLADRALYREASRRALMATRPDAAARGVQGSGAQQAAEEDIATRLALDFGDKTRADQLAALEGERASLGGEREATGQYSDMIGRGADLAGAALPAAGMALDASGRPMAGLDMLSSILSGAQNMPLDFLKNMFSFFGATQDPTMALLQATAPSVGQKAKSFSQSAQGGAASGGGGGGG